MIYYAALGSGSSGNSFYIGTKDEAILVDAGFSLRQIKLRSEQLDLDFSKVQALCITHIHPDHSRTAGIFARQTKLPVFVNENLLDEQYHDLHRLKIPLPLLKTFSVEKSFKIGSFNVVGFSTSHDSPHSVGYNIKIKNRSITILTDTGLIDNTMIKYIIDSDVLFIEANYESKMLHEGPYPFYLKRRIDSKSGHLSNSDTLKALNKSDLSKLEHIFFCHLSKTNNCSTLLSERIDEELDWTGNITICEHGALYKGSIDTLKEKL